MWSMSSVWEDTVHSNDRSLFCCSEDVNSPECVRLTLRPEHFRPQIKELSRRTFPTWRRVHTDICKHVYVPHLTTSMEQDSSRSAGQRILCLTETKCSSFDHHWTIPKPAESNSQHPTLRLQIHVHTIFTLWFVFQVIHFIRGFQIKFCMHLPLVATTTSAIPTPCLSPLSSDHHEDTCTWVQIVTLLIVHLSTPPLTSSLLRTIHQHSVLSCPQHISPHFTFPSDSSASLFSLHFHPEDGGDMFVRNIGLSPNYTALQPCNGVRVKMGTWRRAVVLN
jgi:hypothetical protein